MENQPFSSFKRQYLESSRRQVLLNSNRQFLLITNRNLHMSFRLTPRPMTLDDLELL